MGVPGIMKGPAFSRFAIFSYPAIFGSAGSPVDRSARANFSMPALGVRGIRRLDAHAPDFSVRRRSLGII